MLNSPPSTTIRVHNGCCYDCDCFGDDDCVYCDWEPDWEDGYDEYIGIPDDYYDENSIPMEQPDPQNIDINGNCIY